MPLFWRLTQPRFLLKKGPDIVGRDCNAVLTSAAFAHELQYRRKGKYGISRCPTPMLKAKRKSNQTWWRSLSGSVLRLAAALLRDRLLHTLVLAQNDFPNSRGPSGTSEISVKGFTWGALYLGTKRNGAFSLDAGKGGSLFYHLPIRPRPVNISFSDNRNNFFKRKAMPMILESVAPTQPARQNYIDRDAQWSLGCTLKSGSQPSNVHVVKPHVQLVYIAHPRGRSRLFGRHS